MAEYATARFVIKSNNAYQDLELATELFNESTSVLKKLEIPFRIEVKSGSIEFSIQVLMDLMTRASENPTIAAAIGGAVGAITHRILDRKKSIKKLKFNAAWKNVLKLQKTINRNLNRKIESISRTDGTLKIKFRDGDKVYFGQIKLLLTSQLERERELEKRVAELERELLGKERSSRWIDDKIVEKVNDIGTQDLIMVALRQKPKRTKAQIREVLNDWGKAYGSWFDGSNFSGRLINKSLVKKDGATDAGEDLFSLTKRGEMEADALLSKL